MFISHGFSIICIIITLFNIFNNYTYTLAQIMQMCLYLHLFSIKNIHINMVKEVSYPCITREYGGYNMYPPLLLGRALANTFTHTYTWYTVLFVHVCFFHILHVVGSHCKCLLSVGGITVLCHFRTNDLMPVIICKKITSIW